MGNLCQIDATITFNVINSGAYSLGWVPAKCKPIGGVSQIFPVPNGQYATFSILEDGTLQVYASASLYQWSIAVHMTYMTNA